MKLVVALTKIIMDGLGTNESTTRDSSDYHSRRRNCYGWNTARLSEAESERTGKYRPRVAKNPVMCPVDVDTKVLVGKSMKAVRNDGGSSGLKICAVQVGDELEGRASEANRLCVRALVEQLIIG